MSNQNQKALLEVKEITFSDTKLIAIKDNKTTKFESIKMAVRCAGLMADKINQPITILQRLDSIYPTNTEWGG